MDVISLSIDNQLNPYWHFVVNEVNASYLRSCGVEPIWYIPIYHTIKVVLLHS